MRTGESHRTVWPVDYQNGPQREDQRVGHPRGCDREGLRYRVGALGNRVGPSLSTSWVFKGGTCLKKCHIETHRFSEDLDFTVLPGGPAEASQVIPLLKGVFERVYEESGIDFQGRE